MIEVGRLTLRAESLGLSLAGRIEWPGYWDCPWRDESEDRNIGTTSGYSGLLDSHPSRGAGGLRRMMHFLQTKIHFLPTTDFLPSFFQ